MPVALEGYKFAVISSDDMQINTVEIREPLPVPAMCAAAADVSDATGVQWFPAHMGKRTLITKPYLFEPDIPDEWEIKLKEVGGAVIYVVETIFGARCIALNGGEVVRNESGTLTDVEWYALVGESKSRAL